MQTIRVGIVDDHALVREGLRLILDREPDFEVVGDVADAAGAFTLAATRKPRVMIIDITLGTVGSNTGGVARGEATANLRAHIRAKDYEGIAKDAATLKANFTKIEAFWVARKVDDAINFSRAAVKASTDLETAAKAKDDGGISASASAVAATCRECHQAHRVMQLVDRTFEIM